MATILTDVDGVLSDFVSRSIEVCKLEGMTHDDVTQWDYYKPQMTQDEFHAAILNHPYFWETLGVYPWAWKLLDRLRSEGHKVIFCTAPTPESECPSGKLRWLRKNGFLDTDSTDYMIGPYKDMMAGSGAILIDDKNENVDDFRAAGGEAILFPQNWNRAALANPDPSGGFRILQVMDCLRTILEGEEKTCCSQVCSACNVYPVNDDHEKLQEISELIEKAVYRSPDIVEGVLPDTGGRTEFGTGAVRDASVGKGLPSCIPTEGLRRIARRFEDGALKYSRGNWAKGINLSRYVDAINRHLWAWIDGDREEDHLGAVGWNAVCLIQTEKWIEEGKLPESLNDIREGLPV